MAEEARVTIPGYQPVAGLGKTPSYGVWVRALQTRLDRHVLLKILPLAAPETQAYFDREIAALVRLDGHGVLRVIDEGSAAPVRYLVVDEAGSEPLWESRPSASDWIEVARSLEEIFERIAEAGFVLLPLPREAMRKLPSGHLTLADLGWVLPIGDTIPQHPFVAKELHGTASASHHNRRFLGATLRLLAGHFPGCPRALRNAAQQLEKVADDGDVAPTYLRDLEMSGRGLPVPAIAAVAVVLLVVVGFLLAQLGGDPEKTPDGTEDPLNVAVETPNGGDGESNAAPEPSGTNGGSGEEVVSAEELAAEAARRSRTAEDKWDAILGAPDPHSAIPFPDVLGDLLRTEFEELQRDFPDTSAGRRAQFALRLSDAAIHSVAWIVWRQQRDRVLLHLGAGDLAAAAAAFPGADDDALLPEIEAEREQLQGTLERVGRTARDEIAAAVAVLQSKRDYEGARAKLQTDAQRLTPDGKAWAETLRQSLRAESDLYARTKQRLDSARRAALRHTAAGEWQLALTAVPDVPPLFTELASVAAGLASLCEQARDSAETVLAQLREASSKKTRIELVIEKEGEIEGTILAVDDTGFTLKLSGKTTTRTVALRELTFASLAAVGGIDEARACVLVGLFGALERAATYANAIEPPPPWQLDLVLLAATARQERIQQVFAEAERHFEAPRWGELRSACDRLLERLTPAEVERYRDHLDTWLDAYWLQQGPGIAFAGAVEQQWDASTETLTLRYDFSQEAALADWGLGAGAQRAIRSRAMHMRGSVMLCPPEMWNERAGTSIFARQLSVEAAIKADRKVPNANIVIWASRAAPANGVIGGVGFKPPKVHSVRDDTGTVLYLPANVLDLASLLQAGRLTTTAFHAINPKVTSATLSLLLSGDGEQFRFAWEGRFDQKATLGVGKSPYGTVELRSYGSKIAVRSIKVSGKVRDAWFKAWRKLRIAQELAGP